MIFLRLKLFIKKWVKNSLIIKNQGFTVADVSAL